MSLTFDPEAITGLLAVVTLPAGILAGMVFGGGAAGAVFVVGWLLLVPVSGILFDEVLDLDALLETEDLTVESTRDRQVDLER